MQVRAFSLMELMVVVTIAGIVAAFGIPNYQKSVNNSIAKDAVNNLKLIGAAQELYFARNGAVYPSAGTVDVFQINTNLHLSILQQQGITYSCNGNARTCSAARGSSWTYSINLPATPGAVPTCSAGTCPFTPT
jgi:prepilin-type N-terminal cleavage/methylation domain-containing protein